MRRADHVTAGVRLDDDGLRLRARELGATDGARFDDAAGTALEDYGIADGKGTGAYNAD